jgi:Methyltransferase domain
MQLGNVMTVSAGKSSPRRGTMTVDSPVVEFPFDLDPFDFDVGHWGASLLMQGELLLSLLDAAEIHSVVEVGAYAGTLTRLLVLWAEQADATVAAIDPSPQPALAALADEFPQLSLVRETSLAALPVTAPTDAVVLDGDHNYYTVTEELKAIERWDRHWPLVLMHDVGWPHGRRDDYFDPEQIPAQARQPVHEGGHLFPGVEEVQEYGLPYKWPAVREGGSGNGVRTAVEDFVATRPELQLAVIPGFFGLGVVWSRSADYARQVAAIAVPLATDPVRNRLEENRVLHLASAQLLYARASEAEAKLSRIEPLLEAMLNSRAFWAAEMFLTARQRGKPIFSRRAIRKARAN